MRRIRVVHATALGSENRKGLQLLYGILVQVRLACAFARAAWLWPCLLLCSPGPLCPRQPRRADAGWGTVLGS